MISQFFEIGDNKVAFTITILLAILILLLIISMYSKLVERFLRRIHILEDKEKPRELLFYIFVIMLSIRLIHVFLVQPFVVEGDSMYPNLHSGEILLISKLAYRIDKPAVGDIVVFKYHDEYNKCINKWEKTNSYSRTVEEEFCRGLAQDPYDGKYLVKRIIALPNSTTTYEGKTLVTRDDQYIVMGDNRPESYDSRAWGPLDGEYISGKVFMRVLPVSSFGLNPAPMTDPINLK